MKEGFEVVFNLLYSDCVSPLRQPQSSNTDSQLSRLITAYYVQQGQRSLAKRCRTLQIEMRVNRLDGIFLNLHVRGLFFFYIITYFYLNVFRTLCTCWTHSRETWLANHTQHQQLYAHRWPLIWRQFTSCWRPPRSGKSMDMFVKQKRFYNVVQLFKMYKAVVKKINKLKKRPISYLLKKVYIAKTKTRDAM